MSASGNRHRGLQAARCWLPLAACLVLGAPVSAADLPANPPELPAPVEFGRWVPPSQWTPTQAVSGDLDRDGVNDMVVVLERRQFAAEEPTVPRGARAVQVLFGRPGGAKWRPGPLVPGLLPCTDCTGGLVGKLESVLFDLVVTKDGVLEVGWISRREPAHTRAVRLYLGWNAQQGRLALLADDLLIETVADGTRTRHRRDFVAGQEWLNEKAAAMPPRFIPIENVSAAAY